MPDLDRAASAACRCLLRLNSGELPVDPMAMLVRCRGTLLIPYAQAAVWLGLDEAELARRFGSEDAFTLMGERSDGRRASLVCYRTDGDPLRLRFTLAHELGHLTLHRGRPVGPAEEREADCFASHLLCPRPVLAQLRSAVPGLTDRTAAAVFCVSVSCARAARATGGTPPPDLAEKVGALFAPRALERLPGNDLPGWRAI